MPDKVANPKRKGPRPLLAGLLVVLFAAAFAAAFYFLGGMGIVSGLVASLFPAQTAQAPSPTKPNAVTTTPSGLHLPPGVDEAFAGRMYAEQLQSEENIVKLVSGKVRSFGLGKPSALASGTEIPITVSFADGTSAGGRMGFAKRDGSWYFAYIAGGRGAQTGGLADSISASSTETFGDAVTTSQTVDPDVLNTILEQQIQSQDLLKAIVSGTYASISIDKVSPGDGTAMLEVTLKGAKTPDLKGRVVCIRKDIDGTATWFVATFAKV